MLGCPRRHQTLPAHNAAIIRNNVSVAASCKLNITPPAVPPSITSINPVLSPIPPPNSQKNAAKDAKAVITQI